MCNYLLSCIHYHAMWQLRFNNKMQSSLNRLNLGPHENSKEQAQMKRRQTKKKANKKRDNSYTTGAKRYRMAWSVVFSTKSTSEERSTYTAISRKVVGKSARDNPERYCGWFWVHSSSKKFERIAREAMGVCLWVLKESMKSRFDSKSVREQCIDHIPYYLSGLSRAHFWRQPFSK